jgi:hypothetical protein
VSRSRAWLVVGLVAVIALGLASRSFPLFPAALGKYPGDALWALMVFLGFAWLMPRAATVRLATLALSVSYLVELLQLYQPPLLEAIRSTTLGHLVLGSTFAWPDLIAYAVGVSLGVLADLGLARRAERYAATER